MLTTIHIAGLETYGYHGIFEAERSLGQRFAFDIEARLGPGVTHGDDRLHGSVRYDALIDAVVGLAGGSSYHTLETLGEAIATDLMRQFPPIEEIRLTVSKLSPPIPHILNRAA